MFPFPFYKFVPRGLSLEESTKENCAIEAVVFYWQMQHGRGREGSDRGRSCHVREKIIRHSLFFNWNGNEEEFFKR